jgi:hypothetical protein
MRDVSRHGVERPRLAQRSHGALVDLRASHEVADVGEGTVAQRGLDRLACRSPQAADQAETETDLGPGGWGLEPGAWGLEPGAWGLGA